MAQGQGVRSGFRRQVNILKDDKRAFEVANSLGARFIQLDSVAGYFPNEADVEFGDWLNGERARSKALVLGGVRFKYQPYLLAAVRPGMRACDLFAVFDKTPYLLLDRLSNIGHSLSAHSSYDAGYIDAWNETPMTGAWAIEPFIGNHFTG
jgi:hypothetical protein